MFLVLPGVLLAMRFALAKPAAVDRSLNPIDALGFSWNLSTGLTWATGWRLGFVLAACILLGRGLVYGAVVSGLSTLQMEVSVGITTVTILFHLFYDAFSVTYFCELMARLERRR